MPANWTEEFDAYLVQVQGAPGVITVDLGAARHAPLASHGVRAQVRVKMVRPRPDGLRSDEESKALFALEDRLVETAGRTRDAIYVGRVVTHGICDFFFYVP